MLAAHLGMGGALLPRLADAAPNPPNPYLEHGYAPVADELSVDNLIVRGEIPREIAGAYLRNGPNPAYPPISYTYPFDGDGMVHGLTFDDGKVSYRNRFVQTAGLRADRRAGRTIYGGLTNPIVPDPRFVPPDGDPNRFKNVANINVVRHAGRILALYEGDLPYELTAALETKGTYDFAGKLHGAMTAHPRFDPTSGEMLMFRYSLRPPFLVFYTVDRIGCRRARGTDRHRRALHGARLRRHRPACRVLPVPGRIRHRGRAAGQAVPRLATGAWHAHRRAAP